jgi:hypothetical protein
MTAKVYGGGRRGWHRPSRCECDKIPYRDEAAALLAAAHRGEDAGIPLSVYKCPGSSSWHLTSRGFRPQALKTRPRVLAWHLSVRRVITWPELLREFGLDPDERTNASQKLSKALSAFTDLGLAVRWPGPRGAWVVEAADLDGLRRVMQVGLQEYAESRGTSVSRRRPDAASQ